MICAIDCETTGLTPYYHEMVDLCILPLTDTFDPVDHVQPFIVEVKPEFPDRAEKKALSVNGHTLDELMARTVTREIAVNMFTDWFARTIPKGQKIEPLAQNWFFDYSFITAAFRGLNLRDFIFYRVKDTQRVAEYINDRARLNGTSMPFSSTSLGSVSKALGIVNPAPHQAEGDCITCAQVYKALCGG